MNEVVADDAETDDVIVPFRGFAVVSNSERFNWASSCNKKKQFIKICKMAKLSCSTTHLNNFIL